MLWFKHMSDASNNDFLTRLEDEFGLEGYARWFKLLEAVAHGCEPKKGVWKVAHPWSKWQQILKGKRKKLETFLEHSEIVSRTNQKLTGNILEIEIPKLRELKDEYTRKSGQRPDNVAPDTETDKEEENTPQNPPLGGLAPMVDSGPSGNEKKPKQRKRKAPTYSQSFEHFWSEYPRKTAKAKAWASWKGLDIECQRDAYRAIKAQVKGGHFLGRDGVDIYPHAATWLNQCRWEDEIKASNSMNTGVF